MEKPAQDGPLWPGLISVSQTYFSMTPGSGFRPTRPGVLGRASPPVGQALRGSAPGGVGPPLAPGQDEVLGSGATPRSPSPTSGGRTLPSWGRCPRSPWMRLPALCTARGPGRTHLLNDQDLCPDEALTRRGPRAPGTGTGLAQPQAVTLREGRLRVSSTKGPHLCCDRVCGYNT